LPSSKGEMFVNQVQKRKDDVSRFFNEQSVQDKLNAYFENNENKIEKFKSTMTMLSMEQDFQKWKPMSIMACGIQAAQIGLSPQKSLGLVYFVAYKGQLELTVGYKGWQALLERSGKAVKSFPVYKCDEFSMEVKGFEEIVSLKPNYDEHNEGDVTWVDENLRGILVAIKDTSNGIVYNKFVHKAKLDQLKGQSPSVKKQRFSPWTHFALEMFMAKAIKYVISKTAMDEKVSLAVKIEDELEIKQQGHLNKRGSLVAQQIAQEIPQIEQGEENGNTVTDGSQLTTEDQYPVEDESQAEPELP